MNKEDHRLQPRSGRTRNGRLEMVFCLECPSPAREFLAWHNAIFRG